MFVPWQMMVMAWADPNSRGIVPVPALIGVVASFAVVTSDEALGVVSRESATVGIV